MESLDWKKKKKAPKPLVSCLVEQTKDIPTYIKSKESVTTIIFII